MKEIFCPKTYSGTVTRLHDQKILPMIGIVDFNGTHYTYPFDDTQSAREFCTRLISICDELEEEAKQ